MKNLFQDAYPHIYTELHPTKNKEINFSNIYENSGKKLWWLCKVNPQHIWNQSITRRTKQGYGCPFCSGKRTLQEKSFAVLFPSIASELDTIKNKDFDPHKYSPKSNKIVWWKCKNGHEWQQRIANRVRNNGKCEKCKKIENSLENKYPEIAKEWHIDKNGLLTPRDVSPSFREKVWWKCFNSPHHEWKASVSTRVYDKSGCSQCKKDNKYQDQLPTLEVYSPALAKQWHPFNNGSLKPSDFTAASTKKVWWKCSIDENHEWESSIVNRLRRGRGCPYCIKIKINIKDTLAVRFPAIAKQWHYAKNNEYTPTNVSYGSARIVWWQCEKDKTHEWKSSVISRTHLKNIECPICSIISNSLQTVFPEIAKEWHPTKNKDVNPNQVTRASSLKAWWICSENPDHVWQTQVKNRTLLGSGCPSCSKEKNIIRFTEHLYDLEHDEINYYHEFLSNAGTLRKLTEIDLTGTSNLIQPYYRMIYSSIITSLETYLSDAFYKNVSNNKELLEKCISSNPELTKKQYSLSEVIDWHNNLKKNVAKYLFDIIWHNIPKIKNMYKDVLGLEFPEDISHIQRAIAIRHDLVHRNGRTKEGNVHKLDKKKLLKLISDIKDFIDYLNAQLDR